MKHLFSAVSRLNSIFFNLKAIVKLVFIAAFVFCFGVANAKILRVNNTLKTDKAHNIFASLQEAHDAAAVGDTLSVEGTVTEYSPLTCSKKVVIIGTGYFLTQNTGQASALSSVVQTISFKSGSEGSEIIGLQFSSGLNSFAPDIYVNGIAVIRCYLTNGILVDASISSMVVLQNYITGNNAITVGLNSFSFGGVIFKNNIVNRLSISQPSGSPRIFAAIDHNIFAQDVVVSTASFRSNILISNSNAGYTFSITSNAIQNNLALGTQLNSVPTNQSYQNNASLFVSAATANGSKDAAFKILPTSAFVKAGYNSEEPGVFGGSEPYVLSGIPPIPSIYELQSDAVANKTDGLNVSIKARANQ